MAGADPGRRRGTERALLRARRRRLRPAVVLRRPRRHAEHRPRGGAAACATPTCTPRRCARRPARASSPGATTTPAGWRASWSWRPATPATTVACRSRTACCRRCWSSRATTRSASASGTCPRPRTTRPAGPFHRWPLGRGFERFYGFLGGETNQWYPDLTQDNGSVPQPRPPEDGYHLSEDLADQAIKMILDAHVNAPEKPFFMYYATGAAHAPHHVPKEWADRYKGKFDDGWDAYRETVFARQQEIGLLPADAELSPHDPDVPEWSTLSADERRLYARMMEVFAGFVSHADHHFGRILDTLRAHRRARQHADHDHLRQRRLGRGRSDRLVQRDAVLQHDPRERSTRTWPRSTSSAAPSPTTTTRSAGRGPATRRSAAGSARPTAAARPTRSSCRGPPGSPPATRCARSTPTPSTWSPPCSTPSASSRPSDPRRHAVAARRGQLRPHVRRRRSAPRTTTTSTSRCSATARSTTTAGGRCARGRAPTSPTPQRRDATSATRSPRRCSSSSTVTGGSSTTSPTIPTESHDVAAEHPERLRQLVATVVGRGGEVQGAPARRFDADPPRRRASADVKAAQPASSTTRTAPWCPSSPRRSCTTARATVEADVETRRRRQRCARRPGRRRRRLHLPHGRRPPAVRLQLRAAAISSSWSRRHRCASRPSRPALRVRAHRAARHQRRQGDARVAASCTSTARSSPTPSSRTRRRCCSSSRG